MVRNHARSIFAAGSILLALLGCSFTKAESNSAEAGKNSTNASNAAGAQAVPAGAQGGRTPSAPSGGSTDTTTRGTTANTGSVRATEANGGTSSATGSGGSVDTSGTPVATTTSSSGGLSNTSNKGASAQPKGGRSSGTGVASTKTQPLATGETVPGASTTATGGTTPSTAATSGTTYGEVHSGQYHLGVVDFDETQWTNACSAASQYGGGLRDGSGLGGEYLAGVSNSYAGDGAVCDACILIATGTGRSIVARVITFGITNEPGDIDVSQSVFDALNTDEYPRAMTWKFAKCPECGPIIYEFQTEANVWWTSLWVRNPRVPLTQVEVKSANHTNFIEMERGTDGTLTDGSGFGEGEFTLRLTAMDGQVITDTLPGFEPGQLITSTKQFQ